MLKSLWPKAQPHVLAIALFLVVSVLYCLPAMKGMVVNQHDYIGWKGMAQQSFEYKEKYGHLPLWTNSLFSGMPAFQIAMESKYNITLAYLDSMFRLGLPSPVSLFFLSCLGFYILSNVVGLRLWVSIFGSFAYAFSSYNAVITAVGHTTKFTAMAYVPAVIAGFILLTQRKYILGFVSILVFSTIIVFQNHIQVVYYTLLILCCAALAFTIDTIRKKNFRHLLSTGTMAIIAGLLAGASFAVILLPLNEYAKETMRGGRSELTLGKPKDNKTKGGLDKEYAFRWSYGIDETFTLALPAFKGGSSGPAELGDKSKALESLVETAQENRLPEQYVNQLYGFLSSYWGPQTSGTSGPVYFGVLVVMLAIAGIFLVRSWHLIWILAASLIGIAMAWGSNWSSLNYFLFDYLPFYNKFRAPSMSLIIPQLTLCLLASMALQELLFGTYSGKALLKNLQPALYVITALALYLSLNYFTSEFTGPSDKERKETLTGAFQQILGPQQENKAASISVSIFKGLQDDRKSLYANDLIRFWVFLLLGGLACYLAIKGKLKAIYAAMFCTILILADLIPVDLRYLNKNSFVAEEDLMLPLEPTTADLEIKKDTGYYRVFDQSGGDPFSDSRGAYHHNIINGYHPAKLALYQDLIENQISRNNMAVLNMLNMKYVIGNNPQSQQPQVYTNPDALGPCWIVKNLKWVNSADEEMQALDSIKPLDTAYISIREKSKITAMPQPDSTASIQFVQNLNDKIIYKSQSATRQFAIFSEIYYPHGWKAYIDKKETPIVKANYCFRGLAIPEGTHDIEFIFKPESVQKGDLLGLIIGSVSWLLVLGGLFWVWRRNRVIPAT